MLHLGGWDFHCCIKRFTSRRAYTQMKEQLFEVLQQASAAQVILAMVKLFGDQNFSLQNLFAEERHRIMRLLTQETLVRLDQLYTQVYRDNFGVLRAFHRDELQVPQELQVAAEVALSNRAILTMRSLEQALSDLDFDDPQIGLAEIGELEAVAIEANSMRCQLKVREGKQMMERLILALLWHLLHDANPTTMEAEIHRLERMVDVSYRLNIGLSLDRAQEIFAKALSKQIMPKLIPVSAVLEGENGDRSPAWELTQMRPLIRLAEKLKVDIDFWVSQLV